MSDAPNVPEGWEGLLDPGEVILWQGKPDAGVRLEWDSVFTPIFFLFFTGFSIFWMVMASMAGGFFWTFGLIFFGVGSYNLIGIHFYKAFLRSKTHYTLTSKRGFIAKNVFGRRQLDSYVIDPAVRLQLDEHGRFASVYFASETVRSNKGTFSSQVGFERLNDGREVYGLLRKIQDHEASA